jgi:hypothetical protein
VKHALGDAIGASGGATRTVCFRNIKVSRLLAVMQSPFQIPMRVGQLGHCNVVQLGVFFRIDVHLFYRRRCQLMELRLASTDVVIQY